MNYIGTLSASLQGYLKGIYYLVKKKQFARAKDISQSVGVKNSSVTSALHSLSDKGLINYEPYEIITLTDQGERMARSIIQRHDALRNFFIRVLNIDKNAADESACKMQHCVNNVILERLIWFVEFVEECSKSGRKCINDFGYFCEHTKSLGSFECSISQSLEQLKEKKECVREKI